jgi:hypothetical protein
MAGPSYVLNKGFKVDSAATNVVFGRFAKLGSGNEIVTTAGAGDLAIGVYTETLDTAKVSTGKATVGIAIMGLVRCMAGAAITRGTRVKSDANGKAIACTAALENALGVAMTPASADGDLIDIILTPGNQVAAS